MKRWLDLIILLAQMLENLGIAENSFRALFTVQTFRANLQT